MGRLVYNLLPKGVTFKKIHSQGKGRGKQQKQNNNPSIAVVPSKRGKAEGDENLCPLQTDKTNLPTKRRRKKRRKGRMTGRFRVCVV